MWLASDNFINIAGEISKAAGEVSHDPLLTLSGKVFALAGNAFEIGSGANLIFGDKALKTASAPAYFIAGGLAAAAGKIGHDNAKIVWGVGTSLGTVVMFYGEDIVRKVTHASPAKRILQKFSKIQSPLAGELIYGVLNASLVADSARYLAHGIANHQPKDLYSSGLLLLAAIGYTWGNHKAAQSQMALTRPVASKLPLEKPPKGFSTAPNGWFE